MKLPAPDQLPVTWSDTFHQLDSTKLETYQTCERLYFFEHVLGLRPDYINHNLAFGDCWHQGMEVLFQRGYSAQSVLAAYNTFEAAYNTYYPDDFDAERAPKNKANAFAAFNEYVEFYASDNFNVIGTELSGKVWIGDDRYIIYKLDTVLEAKSGSYFSLEHKTGSALFSWYIPHWKTKIQIGTYTHAFKANYGERADHIVIDAVLFKKTKNEYHRIPIKLTPVDHNHWLQQVHKTIDDIETDFARLTVCNANDTILNAFPKRTPSCVKYNRICPLYDVCFNNINPLRWATALPHGFKREHWNPEIHNAPKETKNESN